VEGAVREELTEWFGPVVAVWRHLKTYRILHALPEQLPPMPDSTVAASPIKPGIFICGEYGSMPGIQWAMLSGRNCDDAVYSAQDRFQIRQWFQKPLYPAVWKFLNSMGCTQQSAQNRTACGIVPPEIGIDDKGICRIIMVF
jgi:hypothetical protein